jgi:type IV pilus assembly protein PilM
VYGKVLTSLINYVRGKLKRIVGVDVGAAFVKILALSQVKDSVYKITEYQSIDIKKMFLSSDTLKRLETRRAAIGLSCSASFSRIIQMNKALTQDEIAEQIEIEAHRMIPYPLEEVYFDFEIIGPSPAHAELVDILFVASKIETVKAHIQGLHTLGLTDLSVGIVDLEALAMERALKWIAYQLPERGVYQSVVLLDIGAQCLTCHAFYNFKTLYSRDHSLNTEQSLLEQIGQVLEQYRITQEGNDIHVLILAGGLVLEKLEMLSEIEEVLGIKTLIANPFNHSELKISCAEDIDLQAIKEAGPSLMLALGLALRNFDYDFN